jgi:hypothetical protein
MNKIRNLPRDRSGILFDRELGKDVFKAGERHQGA